MTLDRNDLDEMAARLVRVPGMVGVLLGGSRARGEHAPESDVDLGLYRGPDLDLAALGALARDLAGADATVTARGSGALVDGGAWLTVSGTAVDWLYRDTARAQVSWETARSGRYEVHMLTLHRPEHWVTGGVPGVEAPYFTALVLEGRPVEQRHRLLGAFTDIIVDVLGVDRGLVRGRIVPVHPDDWPIGGTPASAARRSEIAARATS